MKLSKLLKFYIISILIFFFHIVPVWAGCVGDDAECERGQLGVAVFIGSILLVIKYIFLIVCLIVMCWVIYNFFRRD